VPTDNNDLTLNDIDTAVVGLEPTNQDVGVSVQAVMERLSTVAQEKDELILENEKLRSKQKTIDILDDLIEPYARRTFLFMVGYCVFVGMYLLLSGWGCFSQPADSSVLTFLVGSTATTIIGLVGMVLTGVFIGARPK